MRSVTAMTHRVFVACVLFLLGPLARSVVFLALLGLLFIVTDAVVFVAGDFNYPVDGEGRLNVSTDRVTGGSDAVASHFDGLFHGLIRIAQSRPTRRRSEGGTMTVLSRIDRIYSNLPPWRAPRQECLCCYSREAYYPV